MHPHWELGRIAEILTFDIVGTCLVVVYTEGVVVVGPVAAEGATPVVMSAEELIVLHMHHYSKPATNGIHRIFCEMMKGVLEDI